MTFGLVLFNLNENNQIEMKMPKMPLFSNDQLNQYKGSM